MLSCFSVIYELHISNDGYYIFTNSSADFILESRSVKAIKMRGRETGLLSTMPMLCQVCGLAMFFFLILTIKQQALEALFDVIICYKSDILCIQNDC